MKSFKYDCVKDMNKNIGAVTRVLMRALTSIIIKVHQQNLVNR